MCGWGFALVNFPRVKCFPPRRYPFLVRGVLLDVPVEHGHGDVGSEVSGMYWVLEEGHHLVELFPGVHLFESNYEGGHCVSFSRGVSISFWREGATASACTSSIGILELKPISHDIFYPGDFRAEDVE